MFVGEVVVLGVGRVLKKRARVEHQDQPVRIVKDSFQETKREAKSRLLKQQ